MIKNSFISKLFSKKRRPSEPVELTPIEDKEKIKNVRLFEPDPKIIPVQPKPVKK